MRSASGDILELVEVFFPFIEYEIRVFMPNISKDSSIFKINNTL